MNKLIIFFVGFFSLCIASFGQTSNERILYVIDSIPLLNDPEEWNPILQEDIADFTVIKNKDSLKLLGWEKLDGITYIFTKEYRNRPDSLKRIPGLKQMQMKDGVWNLQDNPYTGKYIDYYNSGKISNEGTLLNGKLNGELVVYFKNGSKKSVANYKNGVLDGVEKSYYTNGALMQTREFTEGKDNGVGKIYFINGQIQNEKKPRKETPYDTAFTYYSNGKVKQMKLMKYGAVIADKKTDELNYYTDRFYQNINAEDIREANKAFFKIWMTDSTSTDTYFKSGLLMLKESRFDRAIAEFDKAIEIEPLMRESLAHRALAWIGKYKFLNAKSLSKGNRETALALEDIVSIPNDEQEKICNDLQQAEYVDFNEYLKKLFLKRF